MSIRSASRLDLPNKNGLKKCVLFQVNDAAVNLRLVVFGFKVQPWGQVWSTGSTLLSVM
jgi:hypothetical protein